MEAEAKVINSSASGVWKMELIETNGEAMIKIDKTNDLNSLVKLEKETNLLKEIDRLKRKVDKYKTKVGHLKSYKALYEALQKQDQIEKTARATRTGEEEQDSQVIEGILSTEELLANLICSICTEYLIHPVGLSCEHIFCHTCIKEWIVDHRSCPVCRNRVPSYERVLPNKFFTQLVEKFLRQNLTAEQLNQRANLIVERGTPAREPVQSADYEFSLDNPGHYIRLMTMVSGLQARTERIRFNRQWDILAGATTVAPRQNSSATNQ